jgi:hypothetical protein
MEEFNVFCSFAGLIFAGVNAYYAWRFFQLSQPQTLGGGSGMWFRKNWVLLASSLLSLVLIAACVVNHFAIQRDLAEQEAVRGKVARLSSDLKNILSGKPFTIPTGFPFAGEVGEVMSVKRVAIPRSGSCLDATSAKNVIARNLHCSDHDKGVIAPHIEHLDLTGADIK